MLTSCSNGSADRADGPTTTAAPAVTTSTSPTASTTTVAPTTSIVARPSTSQAADAEDQAKALYEAWAKGDRDTAARVAQPEAVTALFARPWRATDGWAFDACSGAAGSIICTWQRPGAQVLLRVQNATPVRVSEVRFLP